MHINHTLPKPICTKHTHTHSVTFCLPQWCSCPQNPQNLSQSSADSEAVKPQWDSSGCYNLFPSSLGKHWDSQGPQLELHCNEAWDEVGETPSVEHSESGVPQCGVLQQVSRKGDLFYFVHLHLIHLRATGAASNNCKYFVKQNCSFILYIVLTLPYSQVMHWWYVACW